MENEKKPVVIAGINFTVRGRNITFWVALCSLVVALVFRVLGLFGITPFVTESDVMDVITMMLTVLGMLGVIVDTTTPGVVDSARAQQYTVPGGTKEEKANAAMNDLGADL